MEEEVKEFAKISPDFPGAILASDLASEMLLTAKDKYYSGVFEEAYIDSRNSIRTAASALMLRDGCVASTFEATHDYLFRHYPGMLSLDSWEALEKKSWQENKGIIYRILEAIGIIKKTGKQEAKQAIAAAETFLFAVEELLGRR